MAKENNGRVEFTKEMKKTHTILFPNMCKIHFKILKNVFSIYGYHFELLENDDDSVIETGLKYVHNDTCYPALITIGQMISALESGRYDLEKTALIMTQTGGGCRASNYIHLLRKALKKAGLGHIPVISLNISGLEKNSGFKLTLPLLRKALAAVTYGDMLMLLHNQTEPYEATCGETKALTDKWISRVSQLFLENKGYSASDIRKYLGEMVDSFKEIRTEKRNKVKVGIVGEIFVKYNPAANNNLERFLLEQDCEVMVPGLLGFLLFKVDNRIEDIELYGGNGLKKVGCRVLLDFFSGFEGYITEALEKRGEGRFVIPSRYSHLRELIEPVLGRGCKMGEGWLLTAEMIELIELGYGNIVCTQPFGCLPNHIVGKGMIRKLSEMHPGANIVPIDYDPGATKVNQENRIKLMLSIARESIEE